MTDERYVDGKFVDLVIRDDYVVLCGHRVTRDTSVSPAAWRADWQQMRQRLAARGSMAAINASMHNDGFESYQRMIEE